MKKLAAALGGTLLQRVEGGIELSAHHNIRFCGCGAANAHRWGVSFMTKDGVSFDSGDDSDAWAKPREPYDHLVVKFFCQDDDAKPFLPDEAAAILKTVAAVFDATPCVIHNRGELGTAPVSPSGRPAGGLERLYQFDYEEAIRLYTFPHPSFPDVVEERCFECWQCHIRKPAWGFNYGEALQEGHTEFTRPRPRCEQPPPGVRLLRKRACYELGHPAQRSERACGTRRGWPMDD